MIISKHRAFRVLVFVLCASLAALEVQAAPTTTPTPNVPLSLPPFPIETLPHIPSPLTNPTTTPSTPTVTAPATVITPATSPIPLRNNGAPAALPPATLARLNLLLSSPDVADAHIGVCIQALGSASSADSFPSKAYASGAQPILFSSDGDKRFLPASNMKLFTAALALKVLGPEKTFATRVFAASSTRSGQGDKNDKGATLYIVGGGDPSLTIDDLRQLARDVRKSGITKVDKVVADTSLFQSETMGGRYPDGWTLDDSIWYYGAEVSALALERNQVDVTITGTRSGRAAKVEVDPVLPGFALGTDIIAQVQTGSRSLGKQSESDLIQWDRADANNGLGPKLYVRGQVAPRQVISDGLAIPNVARVVALTFAQQLRAQDISVGGSTEVGIRPREAGKTVAQHDSQPLRVLVSRFLKKSDNLYGEMFLRGVGATVDSDASSGGNTSNESSGAGVASTGMAARAHRLLLDWLRQIDVPTGGLRLSDGSGLSRYNLLTPHAIVSLLAATEKLKGSQAFWDALPIAGADGTLKSRMANTRAANNVRAKTGTFSIASCLSGYVTTRDGQRLAVSVLTNFARNGDQSRQLQNDIFAALADASWAPSDS
jgi:D-alanyl-D-alanine carboxypeptidase/D-alanyl-D-alanine-endopeptidase (penicillin-binding protein 4)